MTEARGLDGCTAHDGELASPPQQPCANLERCGLLVALCRCRRHGHGLPLVGRAGTRGFATTADPPSAATVVETGFSMPKAGKPAQPGGGPGARDELYNASIRGHGHYPSRRKRREPLGKAACIYQSGHRVYGTGRRFCRLDRAPTCAVVCSLKPDPTRREMQCESGMYLWISTGCLAFS